MSDVRFGIVGLGVMGRGHASYLTAGTIKGAVLAAVSDTSPQSLELGEMNCRRRCAVLIRTAPCCNRGD
jgi:predicted dehydrogenase